MGCSVGDKKSAFLDARYEVHHRFYGEDDRFPGVLTT
jgi:hypothetical protein